MKLGTRLMMFTAAAALTGTMAYAAIDGQSLAQSYLDAGYSYVEVKVGPTQTKLEAIKDSVHVEVVYDNATGAIVTSEQQAADPADVGRVGTEVKVVGDDFAGDDNGGEVGDDNGNDANDDNGDDASDDNGGDDNGSDDSGDDDHGGSGGSDDSGSDDSGSDDSGSDDSGSDDSGSDDSGSDDSGSDDSGSDDSGDDDSGDDDHGGGDED